MIVETVSSTEDLTSSSVDGLVHHFLPKLEPVVTDGRVGNKRSNLIDTIPNGSEGVLYFRD